MVAMFSTDSDMLPRKKTTSKDPTVEASTRGSWLKEELDIPRDIYDYNPWLLEKGGTSLKWGEVLYIFKKKNFWVEDEY